MPTLKTDDLHVALITSNTNKFGRSVLARCQCFWFHDIIGKSKVRETLWVSKIESPIFALFHPPLSIEKEHSYLTLINEIVEETYALIEIAGEGQEFDACTGYSTTVCEINGVGFSGMI